MLITKLKILANLFSIAAFTKNAIMEALISTSPKSAVDASATNTVVAGAASSPVIMASRRISSSLSDVNNPDWDLKKPRKTDMNAMQCAYQNIISSFRKLFTVTVWINN